MGVLEVGVGGEEYIFEVTVRHWGSRLLYVVTLMGV